MTFYKVVIFSVIVLFSLTGAQETHSRPIYGITNSTASRFCFQRNSTTNQYVNFIADERNTCWYWECMRGFSVTVVPRVCALQTTTTSFFDLGSYNPCQRRLELGKKFDCTRKELNPNATPRCFAEYQGRCAGVVKVEGGNCWCECQTGFTGMFCTERIGAAAPARPPAADDPCPNGVPKQNWCGIALSSGRNPCQNGGRCINQCINYVCQCTPPFTAGRNCEIFNCTRDVECMNGGICSRGPSGRAQYASCTCKPGFTGVMCEIEL